MANRRNLINKEFIAACQTARDTWTQAANTCTRIAQGYEGDGEKLLADAYTATAEMFRRNALEVVAEFRQLAGKELP